MDDELVDVFGGHTRWGEDLRVEAVGFYGPDVCFGEVGGPVGLEGFSCAGGGVESPLVDGFCERASEDFRVHPFL